MSRTKRQLEVAIKYYKDLPLWSGELNEADKKELAKTEAELKEYEGKNRPTG